MSCIVLGKFHTGSAISVTTPGITGTQTQAENGNVNVATRFLGEADDSAAEIKPKSTAENSWDDEEDDDDDDNISTTSIGKDNASPEDIKADAKMVNKSTNEKVPAESAPGVGEIKGATSEWPDDDDDDGDVTSDAGKDDNSTPGENVALLEGKVESDQTIENEASGESQVSASSSAGGDSNKNEPAPEWPDDDDDDSVQNPSTVDTAKGTLEGEPAPTVNEDTKSGHNDAPIIDYEGDSQSLEKIPRSEFGDDDQVNADSGGGSSSTTGSGTLAGVLDSEAEHSPSDETAEKSDELSEVAAATNDLGDDEDNGILLSGGDGIPSSAYHRNQSSEPEDAAGSEKVVVGGDEKANAEGATPAAGGLGPDGGGGGEQAPQENPGNDAGAENNGIDPNAMGGGAGDPNAGIVPGNEFPNGNNMGWAEGEEGEASFFEMVKATFNVLFLAACFTSVLVFRKRVLDRVRADSNLQVGGAVREELIDGVMRLASWAANAATGGSGGSANAEGRFSSGNADNSRGGSSGPETIPLSTATDEEWGWEDDDMGGGAANNLELPGMGGVGREEEKENDDLALAIAMSLSENDKNGGGEEGARGGGTTAASTAPSGVPPVPINSSFISSTTAKASNKQNSLPTRSMSNSSSTSFNSSTSGKILPRSSAPPPKPMSPPETPPSSAGAGGNSIEDLLGQMGGSGGPVITSFGQKPKKPTPKPKAQKEESSDDLFASMGLSSFPSKPASGPPTRPAPASGGWQPSVARARPSNNMVAATKSAPLPSLLADTLDDVDGDSWGDDDDLDDLLDD